MDACRPIREIDCSDDGGLPLEDLLEGGVPVVLRAVARSWPLVQAGLRSPQAAAAYLCSHYNGQPVTYSWGEPSIAGRPFYTEDFTALNSEVRRGDLDQVIDEILRHADDAEPPMYYVASLLVGGRLPGLRQANDIGLASHGIHAEPSIWIGNRVIASCHYDALYNIACCAAGRRRFTLFPPEQIGNLYPGPLDPTPGGQAVSMVDFRQPDLERYPRFLEAWKHASATVLEPGDAIFIPSLWWHHVEGLEAFNVLVNYWWNSMPMHVPTPMHALYHALWTIRDRSERERNAWREVFEHYVFAGAGHAGEHLPEAARGVLAPLDEAASRQLRAMLIAKLNR